MTKLNYRPGPPRDLDEANQQISDLTLQELTQKVRNLQMSTGCVLHGEGEEQAHGEWTDNDVREAYAAYNRVVDNALAMRTGWGEKVALECIRQALCAVAYRLAPSAPVKPADYSEAQVSAAYARFHFDADETNHESMRAALAVASVPAQVSAGESLPPGLEEELESCLVALVPGSASHHVALELRKRCPKRIEKTPEELREVILDAAGQCPNGAVYKEASAALDKLVALAKGAPK